MSEFVKPASSPLSPDDALPPVQPPSAGFIVQLFVIPGVIVAIIVGIYLMFNWLAQMGNNPQSYIEALEKDSRTRWQAAISLSNTLRDDNYDSIKEDPKTMNRLAAILDKEIESAHTDDESLRLRIYLCQALGYFRISDGLPTLLRAATTQHNEKELPVRLAAVQGIGNLADNVRRVEKGPLSGVELTAALDQLSRDKEPEMRSRVACVYGVLGDEHSQSRLKKMLKDESVGVRYNAAASLARNGDAEILPKLVEMLDPALKDSRFVNEPPILTEEEQANQKKLSPEVIEARAKESAANSLASIQVLGLDGMESLAAADPAVDHKPMTDAIDRLIESKPRSDVVTHARNVLHATQ